VANFWLAGFRERLFAGLLKMVAEDRVSLQPMLRLGVMRGNIPLPAMFPEHDESENVIEDLIFTFR